MTNSVVSSLDFSLSESTETTQRQAPYLQYTTKITGSSTCTATEKANDKKCSGAAANRYVNQNNHRRKESTKRTRQRKRLQKASKKSPACVNKLRNLFSRHTTNN